MRTDTKFWLYKEYLESERKSIVFFLKKFKSKWKRMKRVVDQKAE